MTKSFSRLAALMLAAAFALGAAAQKIKGSDTVLPVSQEGAETYMQLHAGFYFYGKSGN